MSGTYKVLLPEGHPLGDIVLGVVRKDTRELSYTGGFRYFPWNDRQKPSRKSHATPEAAIKGRVIKGARLIEE